MRLPLIKHINAFIQKNDSDFIHETIDVLEHISESNSIRENEMEVIGELLSNLYGGIEVNKSIQNGKVEKEALNEFMQRVLGSIDKN